MVDLLPIYFHQFESFIGKPLDHLVAEVKTHYPFADFDFSGDGRLRFFTGLWLGRQAIVIETPLYVNDDSILIKDWEE